MAKTEEEKWQGRYERWGVAQPRSDTHGTEEDIQKHLKPFKATRWYMQGNELVGESDQGRFVQRLPTDVLCEGTDENGKPRLTRIKV